MCRYNRHLHRHTLEDPTRRTVDDRKNEGIGIFTLIQSWWFSIESHDKAMHLTFRWLNSGASFAARLNSVVQTGVKSAGWEKRMHQLENWLWRINMYIGSNTHRSPIQSCNSISPTVVVTPKLGNSSPNFRAILVLLSTDLEHNLEVAKKSVDKLTLRCCLLCLADRNVCTSQSTPDYWACHLDNHEEIP